MLVVAYLGSVSGLAIRPAYAASLSEAKLTASDWSAGAQLGWSVGSDGDAVIAGAPGDSSGGANAGAAYLFQYAGAGRWFQQTKLVASDRTAGDFFGQAVALSGSFAVVGAPLDDDRGSSSGSVYVFRNTGGGWVQEAKLTASDGAAGDQFGSAVALSGDLLVVGAAYDSDAEANTGAAYVFRRTGGAWLQEAKLTASDRQGGDFFGWSVATDGTAVAIGAPLDDYATFSNAGSAYVYNRVGATWVEQSRVVAAGTRASDQFGRSLAISGDWLFVGAPLNDASGSNAGAAYSFRRAGGSWFEQAQLQPSDGAANDWFGGAVASDGTRVVVGAPYGFNNGASTGTAYVFEQQSGVWSQSDRLRALDGAAAQRYGASVSVSSGGIVIGAYGDSVRAANAGAAYVYRAGVAPTITSTPVLTGDVGVPYSYDVDATGDPPPSYRLVAAPLGMTIDQATGVIRWTPTSSGSFGVVVLASNTVQPDATQSFTLVIRPAETNTPTSTVTATSTSTSTPTPTSTSTSTPTATETASPTMTETVSPVPTMTETATPTLTETATPTATSSTTPLATETTTPTPTTFGVEGETATSTPTETKTSTPTETATGTLTSTPSSTPSAPVIATATTIATSMPTGTPVTGEPVSPIVECVSPYRGGSFIALFGYNNPHALEVTIPVGADNRFERYGEHLGQPTVFTAGRQVNQFAVIFDGEPLVWTLSGRTATASREHPTHCGEIRPRPGLIVPLLESLEQHGDGSFTARFGYLNLSRMPVAVPIGSRNRFFPEPQDLGQPTVFAPGRHRQVFSIRVECGVRVWFLNGLISVAPGNRSCQGHDGRAPQPPMAEVLMHEERRQRGLPENWL
jgi:hypothetical protein